MKSRWFRDVIFLSIQHLIPEVSTESIKTVKVQEQEMNVQEFAHLLHQELVNLNWQNAGNIS